MIVRGKTKSLALVASLLTMNSAWADQLSGVCGNLSNAGALKTQYCQAAQAANKAAGTDGALWKVYAAVSAVCTTACVSSFAGSELYGSGVACEGTSLAASATDAIMTKNYTTALAGIAVSGYSLYSDLSGAPSLSQLATSGLGGGTTAAGGAAAGATTAATSGGTIAEGSVPDSMNAAPDQITRASQAQGGNTLGSGSSTAADAAKTKDWTACASAAMGAMQSYSHYNSQKSEEQTEQQNLASAAAITNTTTDLTPGIGTTAAGIASAGSANTGASQDTVAANQATTTTGSGSACGSSAASTMQCAIASDSGLANTATPQFAAALQKSSGMPLGQFISSAQNPNQAITSGLSGSMTPTGTSKVADALNTMESGLDDVNGATMMALGRGGGGGGSANNDDPSAMMAGLLDKLMPKKGDEKKSVNDEDFTQKTRALASANPEENRNLSIFDRIAYRYVVLTPRLLGSNTAAKPATRTN